MATLIPNQLNPNAPLYIPLPPPLYISTPQFYYCHVIPTNCQLKPPELLPLPSHLMSEARFPVWNRFTGGSRRKSGKGGDIETRVQVAEETVMMRNIPKQFKFTSGSRRNRRLVCNSGKSGKGGDNETRVQVTEETVMIRNIPKQFNRQLMLEFLDKLCYNHNIHYPSTFHCEYDFLYLPMDFRTGYNLGYAFVNFTSSIAAHWIKETLGDYKWGVVEDSFGVCHESKKICCVTRARIQGKQNLVAHFRASKFTCHTTDYLPVILLPPRDGTTSFSSPVTVGRHFGSH